MHAHLNGTNEGMSDLWQLDSGLSQQLPDDICAAVQWLTELMQARHEQVAPFFSSSQRLLAARAPGRLDVMGGIADYSGSTVLQLPLRESTVVLCQSVADQQFRVLSQTDGSDGVLQVFSAPVTDFIDTDSGQALSDQSMRDYFHQRPDKDQWAAYVAGVFSVLMQQINVCRTDGVVLLISSAVPIGKGVSSSAALEIASMRALCAWFDLKISSHQQAVLCQRVENHIVGAPCGLMDQMASSCGQKGALLSMLCQPDVVGSPVHIPDGLAVWGIDSGIRHAVSGADYGTVRVATFMGYRYLLEAAGIASRDVPARDIQDTRWHGYLANISVAEFNQFFYTQLPEKITGQHFLDHFDATTDNVTQIHPERTYAVRACTVHPVNEHFRVRLFAELATSAADAAPAQFEALANLMGECMYQSHAGYSSCGLGSAGTDDLVARLRAVGQTAGIYGARITGGGSGGVVAVLAGVAADARIRSIAAEYMADSGWGGYVFSGSSAGACVFELIPVTVG